MIEVSRRQLLQGGVATFLLGQGLAIGQARAEGSTVTSLNRPPAMPVVLTPEPVAQAV